MSESLDMFKLMNDTYQTITQVHREDGYTVYLTHNRTVRMSNLS